MLPGQLENEISAQVDRRSRDLLHALPTVMWAMSTFNTEQVGVPRKFYQKRKRKFIHQTTNSKKKKEKISSMAFLPLALFHGAYQICSVLAMSCQVHILLRKAPRVMRRPVHIDRAESLMKIPLSVRTCTQAGNKCREH